MTAEPSAASSPIPLDGQGAVPTARRTRETQRIPGEIGVWIFILGDMMVFAVMFGAYLFYRGRETTTFNQSQQNLVQGFGIANTLVLLVSSLFVVFGMRAIRDSTSRIAVPMFAGAIGCGLIFSALKFIEWSAKFEQGLNPTTNNFYMFYYLLTGLHLVHLIVGLGVLVFLIRTARSSKVSDTRFAVAEGGACFWHMVDLLWIVIFPLLYLVH